jgi:hypothetical protein
MRYLIKSRILKKSSSILFFSFLLLFLSSCTNLAHIKKFAEISTETATFDQLVDNYVGYPDRVASLQPESQKQALEKIRQERLDQRKGLKALHKTVDMYMTALGELAEDNVASYDAELDSLGQTLAGSRLVKPETVAASGKISKILFNAFTNQWRKSQLKEIIDQSNTDFQTLTSGLKFIVENGFMNSLDEEMAATVKAFRKGMMDAKHRTQDKETPPAIALLLEEWKFKKQTSIEDKKKLITSYTKILDKISQGHQSLYDNRNDLSKKTLIAELKKHGKSLKEIYKFIQNL